MGLKLFSNPCLIGLIDNGARSEFCSIAAEEFDDPAQWRLIAKANQMDNPRQIAPGQRLTVPPFRPDDTSGRWVLMFASALFEDTSLPAIAVRINGTSNLELSLAIEQVTVTQDLESPSMVEIHLANFDVINHKITWSDSSLLGIGTSVDVSMGYSNRLKPVISAEITGLEPEFSREAPPKLVVRGHDLRHRLLYGRQTRSFTQMKDSAIAQQIASQRGLVAKTKDTKIVLDYVMQHNQTDLEFLQEQAQRIGYEVWVGNKTLYFQPHQHDTQKSLPLSLNFESNLLEFFPRLSSLTQTSHVEVRGWDVKNKQVIIGKARAGNEASLMGGFTSGAKAVQRMFGTALHTVNNQPVQSKAEADQMALGQFNERSLAYITGEGTCLGNASLRAGSVIEIKGVGQRFSGLYYVTTATHTFTNDEGYRTEFTVRRTAT
ncbi:contractile injection system protein, VgrG/Pvc8 family [Leptothermofonsia sp. ETS-13]|uniref:contractile injection system protein, VgrG/Pvc8 family n=1 Tax=Leptothermofonsia sp. ETS-13 TaxID=3035696 RepID=UPI003B9E0E34